MTVTKSQGSIVMMRGSCGEKADRFTIDIRLDAGPFDFIRVHLNPSQFAKAITAAVVDGLEFELVKGRAS